MYCIHLYKYRLLSLPFHKDSDPNGLINHVWLQIDDYFEIDIVRDELNQYLHDGGVKQIPVVVSRSRLYAQDDPWGGSRYRFFMLAGMLLLFSLLHKNVQIHIK